MKGRLQKMAGAASHSQSHELKWQGSWLSSRRTAGCDSRDEKGAR